MSALQGQQFVARSSGVQGSRYAAAVAASLMPGSRALAAAAAGVPPALGTMPQGDWRVDDICMAACRAMPIRYRTCTIPRPRVDWALAAPVDWHFIG